MTKQEQKKRERIELLKELKETLKDNAINNNELIAQVVYVSSSGMSRRIKFYYFSKKDKRIYNITYRIAKILGYRFNNSDCSLVVGGCGMDMIFNCLYNLNAYAVDYGIVRPTKEQRQEPKSRLYYNSLVNTHYQSI